MAQQNVFLLRLRVMREMAADTDSVISPSRPSCQSVSLSTLARPFFLGCRLKQPSF